MYKFLFSLAIMLVPLLGQAQDWRPSKTIEITVVIQLVVPRTDLAV